MFLTVIITLFKYTVYIENNLRYVKTKTDYIIEGMFLMQNKI